MRNEGETIAGAFKRLNGERSERLEASELYAYYTIPSVFPRADASDNSKGVGMLDSIGAAVVNHFSNKLVTTLFSPNRPFFRLMPDPMSKAVKKLYQAAEDGNAQEQDQAKNALTDLRSKFVKTEKNAVRYLERIGYRTSATNAAKLLVVTGDVVLRSTKNKPSTVYSMRDYVCEKDLTGRDVILIVRDSLAYGALSTEQQKMLEDSDFDTASVTASTPVTIYTSLELMDDGRYQRRTAIENIELPKVDLFTEKSMPFTHLSWNLTKGENYGRGLVEDYSGSFHVIDKMSQHQTLLIAKLADLKIMVDPASGIDVEHLNSSETGTYVSGKPSDVQPMASGMDAGIQYIEGIVLAHKRQISAAFLYQTGQVRDAERVTAEEIRENAAELEIAHGGVYSRFAADWQSKVAYDSVSALGEEMGDVVEPQIMTGMDSLSRTGEMQAIRVWMTDLSLLNQLPEGMQAVVKGPEFAQYAAVQRGVDHGAFVKSPNELAAEQKAAQEEAMAQEKAMSDMKAQEAAASAVAKNM